LGGEDETNYAEIELFALWAYLIVMMLLVLYHFVSLAGIL